MDLSRALDAPLTAERRRVDPSASALVGSRCGECAAPSWPNRAVCHRCGSANMNEEVFSRTGVLVTHTMTHVPRPGLESPYMLGQVQLDEQGPLVFGLVRGAPADMPVPTVVHTVVDTERGGPAYWFEQV